MRVKSLFFEVVRLAGARYTDDLDVEALWQEHGTRFTEAQSKPDAIKVVSNALEAVRRTRLAKECIDLQRQGKHALAATRWLVEGKGVGPNARAFCTYDFDPALTSIEQQELERLASA